MYLVRAADTVNVWDVFLQLAQMWQREDALNPQDPAEADFFKGRLIKKSPKKKTKKNKKNKKKNKKPDGTLKMPKLTA